MKPNKAQQMADTIDNDEIDMLPMSRSEIAYMIRTQDTAITNLLAQLGQAELSKANAISLRDALITKQDTLLRQALEALDVAFAYDDDVFGVHHNSATDTFLAIQEHLK